MVHQSKQINENVASIAEKFYNQCHQKRVLVQTFPNTINKLSQGKINLDISGKSSQEQTKHNIITKSSNGKNTTVLHNYKIR